MHARTSLDSTSPMCSGPGAAQWLVAVAVAVAVASRTSGACVGAWARAGGRTYSTPPRGIAIAAGRGERRSPCTTARPLARPPARLRCSRPPALRCRWGMYSGRRRGQRECLHTCFVLRRYRACVGVVPMVARAAVGPPPPFFWLRAVACTGCTSDPHLVRVQLFE